MKKKITIKILKKDWHQGIDWADPCGCLLANAASRVLDKAVRVWPGLVRNRYPHHKSFNYTYDQWRCENKLCSAHVNPGLLPMQITLTKLSR